MIKGKPQNKSKKETAEIQTNQKGKFSCDINFFALPFTKTEFNDEHSN